MSDITLNASMRSNLLSLKNIATQMDKTQLILATGKKVNSAIDKASSYYQARSLTNRAADLTALLDSMGQGIQTIEAANVGIEKATSLLEQMTSIANQAGTIAQIPSKEDIAQQLGENGAVVTTAQELYDAIQSGKETICVYGHIDLGNIDDNGKEINLQAGQKLVGAEYFASGSTGGAKFSSLTATASVENKNMINITKSGCMVSDLSISYSNEVDSGLSVYAINSKYKTTLNNLDIVAKYSDASTISTHRTAINVSNNSDIKGKININVSGRYGRGISGQYNINCGADINIKTYGYGGSGLYVTGGNSNISERAKVNIQTYGNLSAGIYILPNVMFDINSDVKLNLKTSGESSSGISANNGSCNINFGSEVNIETLGNNANGIQSDPNSFYVISGNLSIVANKGKGINLGGFANNQIKIMSTAHIYINSFNDCFYNTCDVHVNGANVLAISQGAKIAVEKDGKTKWYEVKDDYTDENTSTTTNNYINASNIETELDVAETSAWSLPQDLGAIPDIVFEDTANSQDTTKQNLSAYQNQFNTALKEYDKLLSDCGYQGINLLKGGNLKLTFDENRQNIFNISGRDISSNKLGLNEALWQNQGDIEEAINQLNTSITTLRSLAENLGNQYSIITTRINFTESLTDILETGADDLTLADMNEASAQYLSLQTRQQLAINSLSLASMSARSILSLFY